MNALFQELLQTGIYKRSQGRITRQVTFAVLAVIVVLGTWRLSQVILWGPAWRFGLPGLLLVIGLWISYRMVNVAGCADFLIAVEAEINKVSWPTRHELFRASIVVLITIFSLAIILSVFDVLWWFIFKRLGII